MAAVEHGPLSYRMFLEEVNGTVTGEVKSESSPQDGIIFVGVSLVLGIASRHVLRGTRVPYTVALLLLGVGLGALEYGTSHGLGKLGSGIRIWANINPDLLLGVFLPALLFESSFAMEVHQIKRCIVQMILLAGPGVLTSTFCLGSLLKLTFPYNWDWKTSLLLGGLLSATDPVAVVALLKDLGASKKLSTIIEGESLMNDGTAIVVYQLFYRMVLGEKFGVGSIIKFLSEVPLGAVAVGLAFGIVSVLWLGFIFNDTIIEITITLAVSYIAFYTSQEAIELSGVLTVMTVGMFYAAAARTAFKGESQESLHHFWEMVAYIANTLIFILSGVVIGESVMRNESNFESDGATWGYLILLYAYVQLSRVAVVAILFPLLRYFGYGLEFKEALILIWAGLRGAVALSLSLSVKRASDSLDSPSLKQEVGTLFVFFTGGIVFLTLIINGSTTQFLLHFLAMDKLSAAKIRILNYTKYEMLNKAIEAFEDLGEDEELGPADWPTVKKYITCLNDLEGEKEHPHTITESENHLHHINLSDTRVRLLNGVQAAYWEMLDEGRITQTTGILLMQSVDEAMDTVSHEPLCDWKALKSYVHFPKYYKFLQMSRIPQRLVTYFTVERLESACYISAAFLRAHRTARRQLHEFIGESEIAAAVINESNAEGEDARNFLEDVRISFPQVLRAVKTKQVTYSVLKHLSEYVQTLEKVGLLEEKEMLHLDDAVQTDLKKLLRNPPLVKMPKVRELLDTHPLLGVLPKQVRVPLENSTKETMKIKGTTLYKEGSKPNGIWLISNGVVKWASKTLSNRQSLHPTFLHGSTLGLYEVLVGKPFICDMITDSLVHCFFIEAEKIVPLLRSDPDIEEFLWQESSIVIAKLLLPPVFEKLSLQEVRGLIAERSRMNIYISGEFIEIPHNSVCILLEGFLKTQDAHKSLIASPAVLLPSNVELSFLSLESSGIAAASFCHRGNSYMAEARARVILFEIGATEPPSPLQRRQSSWMSHSIEPQKLQEHGGLMSWPENLQRARSHQILKDSDHHANNMSTRAMELNIFGSMVEGTHKHHAGVPKTSLDFSKSYHRIPSETSPLPLVSTRSEGESLGKRLGQREKPKLLPPPPKPVTGASESKPAEDNSSDESGAEEEIIVRIDSPSHIDI
uniref:Putative Na/H antiporter n=1 Tax=Cymodocea nodosa TaxID=55448 RepID=Q8GUE7_9LILI|nr:putative Na/H antiporter [Cymodocea nodosa]